MTPNLYNALRQRYPEKSYALLFEVRDGAGFDARRSADAIAISLWPSRGLEVHGIEIKTARGDFLRELKDPAKSDPIQRYCDRWWIVAGDRDVARGDELPATWGLLAMRGERLVQVKAAPKLDPAPLDRGFVVAMMKRAAEGTVSKDHVNAEVERRLADRVEKEVDRRLRAIPTPEDQSREIAMLRRSNEALRASIDAFEASSGVRISPYDGSRLGQAVALVTHRRADLISAAARIRDSIPTLLTAIDELGVMEARGDGRR